MLLDDLKRKFANEYREGAAAFKAGKDSDANPYPESNYPLSKHRAWFEGWYAARLG